MYSEIQFNHFNILYRTEEKKVQHFHSTEILFLFSVTLLCYINCHVCHHRYIPDNLVLLLQVSRGEIHSLVDIRMSSYGTSSYKVWTVVAALKRRRRSIDEAIALRRCQEAKTRISSSLNGPRTSRNSGRRPR